GRQDSRKPARANDADAVGDFKQMLEFRRDVENRHATGALLENLVLHELDGTDIETLGGLHHDQDARPYLDLPRQNDFLLVAPGKETRLLFGRTQANIVARYQVDGTLRNMAVVND